MLARAIGCLALGALLLPAAQKTVATANGENQDLRLTVTLYIDPEGVKQLVGNNLDGHFIVADVKLEPKYGKEVVIDRDDFQIRTDKDGEKTTPFAPGQIAGRGALIIRQNPQARTSGGVGIGAGYPGGYPGDYPPGGYPPGGYPPGGYPYPGEGGAVAAGSGGEGNPNAPTATATNPATEKVNPLERTLKDKELPQKKTDQPVSGLLYFAMEKQKMKDLELTYGGKENRITMRFK